MIESKNFVGGMLAALEETFEKTVGIYLDRGTSLFETLAEISHEEASIAVGGKCATLAAQVKHTTFYLDVLLNYVQTREDAKVDWNEIWRNTHTVSADEWLAIQQDLRNTYARIKVMVTHNEDWNDQNTIGGAMGMLMHTAYHLGEIRQALCTLK